MLHGQAYVQYVTVTGSASCLGLHDHVNLYASSHVHSGSNSATRGMIWNEPMLTCALGRDRGEADRYALLSGGDLGGSVDHWHSADEFDPQIIQRDRLHTPDGQGANAEMLAIAPDAHSYH